MNTESARKWASIFAEAINTKAGIPKRKARGIAWAVIKAFNKNRCYECGANVQRGGERQGAYLCQQCYESD